MSKTSTQLVSYKPSVDLQQFRLVAEPTTEALANDVEKFSKISDSGMDMHILGTFLLGVSLIKLKKIVGNAKRGVHGGGDPGWLKFKEERFPNISNRSLSNAVTFSKDVFQEWQNPKFATSCKLRNGDKNPNETAVCVPQEPLDFQLPENPDELKGLLTAIHDTMDGKTITACYRSAGRIREAQTQGTYNRKPRDLRKSIEDAAEVDEEACKSWISDTLMLADGRSPILGEQKITMLHKLEQTAEVLLASVRKIIKARKSASPAMKSRTPQLQPRN
jgi:hypothetical protein